MVTKGRLIEAVDAVESALEKLPDAKGRVRIVVNDLDHIHAVVGSARFKNVGLGERQEVVWEFLGKNVERSYLSHLFRVEPMDVEEFSMFIRDVQLRALSNEVPDED